jgi:hypothetical protein
VSMSAVIGEKPYDFAWPQRWDNDACVIVE